jgi:hypothetical protein
MLIRLSFHLFGLLVESKCLSSAEKNDSRIPEALVFVPIPLKDGQGNHEEIIPAEVVKPRTNDLDVLIRKPAQDEPMDLGLAYLQRQPLLRPYRDPSCPKNSQRTGSRQLSNANCLFSFQFSLS